MTEEQKIKNRQNVKEWKKKNPDKVKAQKKRYKERHREEIKQSDRNRYRRMKEKAKSYDNQLIKIRDELFDLLRECASRVWEMKDGSSEAFLLGADYGYNDAAAAVYNYLNEKIKEQ